MKKEKSFEDIYKLSLEKLKAPAQTYSDGGGNNTDSALMDTGKLDALLGASEIYDTSSGEQLYTYYRDMYSDAAAKASENAFGLASANTGGYGSTYAASAARSAYDRYMKDFYGAYEDAAEKRNKSARENFQNALSFAGKAAQYGDYSYYEALGMDMSGARKADSFTDAVNAAKYGDYSGLEALGYDTGLMRYSELLELARQLAEYGDYSGLEALGVDVSSVKEKEKLEKALSLAKYGDMSLLGDYSAGIAAMKSKIGFTIQKGAETAYANGGYTGLKRYLDRQVGYGQLTEKDERQIISALTGR